MSSEILSVLLGDNEALVDERHRIIYIPQRMEPAFRAALVRDTPELSYGVNSIHGLFGYNIVYVPEPRAPYEYLDWLKVVWAAIVAVSGGLVCAAAIEAARFWGIL